VCLALFFIFFVLRKSFSSCSSRNELSQKIMVLELISRLEIDRSAVRESESDDEDGTATTTNTTASSNVLKINVKEERDCDNVPLRTGLRVWSATFIFGENVLRSEIENKKVLELGSGTGVNGLICAKLNASSVMCTDVDIKSVNLCVANAMLNKEFDVVSRVLDWGDANTYFQGESFPVIVAVDVVYLEEHAKELANCVAHHLCKESGTFLCVCGVRKREYFETFLRELAERDMEVYFDEVGLMPKSNREQVEEIRSNHKHDEELLEDGKGYRMIRARFKKVIGREAERNEEEGESEALAGFLDDLDIDGAGRMKRQQAYDMSSSTSDDDDEEEEHDSSGKKVESVPFLCSTVASASHSLLRNGFCVFRDEGFAQTQTEILEHVHSCCQNYLNDLLERCKTKHGIKYETDIFRFKEICSRAVNGKRFDFQATKLSDSDDVKKLPESGKAFAEVLQTLANIVEQKCEKIFETVTKGGEKKMEEKITIVNRGCVTSLPKAPEQHFHADGRKEGMYNCFVALHDVPKIQGPTEFIFGSHKFDHDAPYVDTKTRKRQEKAKRIAPELRKGDILLYDYRTLHRGGENKRCHDRRAISYFLFDTKGGSGDTWNFEDASVWDD
jgi:predicted nicotinamide N-methyase